MIVSANGQFLHVRRCADAFEVDGAPTYRLGEALPNSGGKNGVWARWDWDGRELVVRNGSLGFRPLYFFSRPGEVAVASSLVTLLEQGAPRELDDDALAVFFHLGYFLDDETPFRAVRVLPPNSVLRWRGDVVEVSTSPRPRPEKARIGREAALSEYQKLFAQAIRRRLGNGPSAILLSGGKDSRHILLEILAQGGRLDQAVTIDRVATEDGPVAAAVAEALGIPHRLLPASFPSLEHEQRRIVETDFCADEHSWILPLRDGLVRSDFTLYDGIAGDVMTDGEFVEPHVVALFRKGRFREIARLLIEDERLSAFVSRFLVPEVAWRFREERAVGRLAEELARHADAPNPAGSFFFWNRTRREIALSPFAIFGDFRVHTPFLDIDLIDFASTLPAEMFRDETFHEEMIARAYPQWAHLPYARHRRRSLRFAALPAAWRLRRWLATRPETALNLSYLLPRLARAGVDPFYNRNSFLWLTNYPVYWAMLEEYAGGQRCSD